MDSLEEYRKKIKLINDVNGETGNKAEDEIIINNSTISRLIRRFWW